MDIYAFVVLGAIIGYLIGSIPFALVIGKIFYKVDVRNYGSKNLGATNVTRTLGVLAGIIVLLLDLFKGGLPAFIFYKIAENTIINNPNLIHQAEYLSIVYCVTGVFTCLGHCHPVFAGFRGGKAVASICGFLLFMNIWLFIIGLTTYLIIVLITKIVSISSISAAFTVLISSFIPIFKDCYLFTYNELNNTLSLFIYYMTVVFLALLLIYRHIPNINRLLKGQEKKFHIEKVNKKDK